MNDNCCKRTKKYLVYMFFILILIEILDVYTTGIVRSVTTNLIADFLPNYSQDIALSKFALYSAIANFGSLLVIFFRVFSDIFGRKLLLVITTIGIGVGAFLIISSVNILMLTGAMFISAFFLGADIWTFYIAEEVPAERRSFLVFIGLIFGLLGGLLVPVVRSVYVNDVSSNWRGMYYLSIILSALLALIVPFTIKETAAFQKMKDVVGKPKVSSLAFLKRLFAPPQRNAYIVLLIGAFFYGVNLTAFGLFQPLIKYSENFSEKEYNLMLFVANFSIMIGYVISGYLSDRVGRKPMLLIMAIMWPPSVILILIGSTLAGGLPLVLLGAGLSSASYFGGLVLTAIITYEVNPTEIRGTGSGLKLVIGTIGMIIGGLMSSALIARFGIITTFVVIITIFLVNVPLYFFHIEETKGVDLVNA